ERMRRVGILMPFSPSDKEAQNRVQAFKAELQNRGWTAGANVQFDERWTTDNMDLIHAAAANLLELKPDAVIAIGGRVIRPDGTTFAARPSRRGDRIGRRCPLFGPKRTSLIAPHMSAFGGKADITFRGCPLSRSLSGVKQTSLVAAHMSACDPKRTW